MLADCTFLSIAAEIVALIVSAARRTTSTSRWLYLAVVAGWLSPQKLPDDRKPERRACTHACKRMPQIVNTNAFQAGCTRDGFPGVFKSARGACLFEPGIMYGLSLKRASDVSTASRRRDVYRLRTRFEIGKIKHAALVIDMFPLACSISRRRAPVKINSRIAAKAKGSTSVRRFAGEAKCLAFGFVSSTSQRRPEVSASRSASPRRPISSLVRNRSRRRSG